MAYDFGNSAVFITGGGAGIGKATAELFLKHGARVGVLDLDVSSAAPGCDAYIGSVTDDAAVTLAVNDFAVRHGRIDILVNNAGITFYGTIEDGTLDDWMRVIDVNLLGVARVSRAALPHIRKSDHGAIVNIASCLADTGLAGRALYSATKGGVAALSRAMAADLVREGIRVNSVHPGTVDTKFISGLIAGSGTDKATFAARQMTGELVSPDEVAHAIAYLARPGARSTVGSALTVEAGFGTIRF